MLEMFYHALNAHIFNGARTLNSLAQSYHMQKHALCTHQRVQALPLRQGFFTITSDFAQLLYAQHTREPPTCLEEGKIHLRKTTGRSFDHFFLCLRNDRKLNFKWSFHRPLLL